MSAGRACRLTAGFLNCTGAGRIVVEPISGRRPSEGLLAQAEGPSRVYEADTL
jgi:hypothetical protein